MKTTTDHAADVRAAYKAHGWNSRDISVRADYFSMGSSLDVVIKAGAIAKGATGPVIRRIAEGAESIRRCEYSGEILGGGNRYVSVSYDKGANEVLSRRHYDAVSAAAALLDPSERTILQPIAGTEFHLGWASCPPDPARPCYALWSSSMRADFCNDIDEASVRLARLIEDDAAEEA